MAYGKITASELLSTGSDNLTLNAANGQDIIFEHNSIKIAQLDASGLTMNSVPLIGNVTGDASGTSLTVTQAAQTAITSLGTLTVRDSLPFTFKSCPSAVW